jgi:hypothetical protein
LKGCQRSGKKVICSAWVTQTNKDIQLLYRNGTGHTRLVDAAGTEYPSASIQVGSQINNSQGGSVTASLVKDVPIQLLATFTDIPTSVQDIALFELGFNYAPKGQLRNTKITESQVGNSPAIKKKE